MKQSGMTETQNPQQPARLDRSEKLDAVECLYLADLLEQQAGKDGEDYAATVGKLRRMAERLANGDE